MNDTDASAGQDLGRLRWRCRRGMQELDLLLGGFLTHDYAGLGADDRARFATLLDTPDPELNDLIVGRSVHPDAAVQALLTRIAGRLPAR
ncbi:MAG: succinate dehydrogenase assembly factor 2 [Gammaproteobacteria bacterium]|nr:succinate dehydrogenase assembly factor 2 [Gammaproteobacteria bacterium]